MNKAETAFCINLAEHKEKWDAASTALAEHGFTKVERLDAVKGREIKDLADVPVSLYSRYLLKNPKKRCAHEQLNSLGAIGCTLSHVQCWKMILDRGLPGAFVFEDDIKFVDDFNNAFSRYEKLPSEIELFSFGYWRIRGESEKVGIYRKASLFIGTNGYYVTKEGARKLLENAFPIEIHVDAYIALMGIEKRINLAFSEKVLIAQDVSWGSSVAAGGNWKCMVNEKSALIVITLVLVLFIISHLLR